MFVFLPLFSSTWGMVLFLGLMTYVIVESVRLGRVVRYARQQRSHTPTGAN